MLKLYANARAQHTVTAKSASYLDNIMTFLATITKEYDNPQVYNYTALGVMATAQFTMVEDILGLIFFGPSFRQNPNYNKGINIRSRLFR